MEPDVDNVFSVAAAETGEQPEGPKPPSTGKYIPPAARDGGKRRGESMSTRKGKHSHLLILAESLEKVTSICKQGYANMF